MNTLNIDLTVPLGDAGSIRFAADIADLGQLCPEHRQALADTCRDFLEFAAGTIAPPPAQDPPAEIKRDLGGLAGIDGGRAGGRA